MCQQHPVLTVISSAEASIELCKSSAPRGSLESTASQTNKIGMDNNGRSAKPMKAISSLRQHTPRHSSKKERQSISSIIDRIDSVVEGAEGPERYVGETDGPMSTSTPIHNRRSSIAQSLRGSLRGLVRISSQKKKNDARSDQIVQPAQSDAPVQMLMPSSPIDVPAAAPLLPLDFGIAGFVMSPTFGVLPDAEMTTTLLRLTDPANITTGVPIVYGAHTPAELHAAVFQASPFTPKTLLTIPSASYGDGTPPCPGTPMPGTNMPLDLDGANSERSQLFERGVECTDSRRDRKTLRTMSSLSAMAEACAIAHRHDEAPVIADPCTPAISVEPSNGSAGLLGQPSAGANTSMQDLTGPAIPDERKGSLSTLWSCPSDMPRLSRQTSCQHVGANMHGKSAALVDKAPAVSAVAESGPPSPSRSVKLPLRLKAVAVDAHSALDSNQGTTSVEDHAAAPAKVTTPRQPSTVRLVDHTDSPASEREAIAQNAQNIASESGMASASSGNQPPCSSASSSESAESTDSAMMDYDTFKGQIMFGNDGSSDRVDSARASSPVYYEAGDDVARDSPRLLNELAAGFPALSDHGVSSAFDYLEYDPLDLDSSSSDDQDTVSGLSPHNGPLGPQLTHISRLYHSNSHPGSSSPTRTSMRTTDVGWLFTQEGWLGDAGRENAGAGSSQYRFPSISLDSNTDVSSHDSPEISPISPSSDQSGRMPSMGEYVDFEAARAARNARYNALDLPYVDERLRERSQRNDSAEFVFRVDSSAEHGLDEELQLADFGNACTGSSSRAADLSTHRQQSSDDGIDRSLRDAVSASYDLEQSLYPATSSIDLLRTEEDAELEEVTASPTGGLESSGFSPTTPRKGAFENRFAVLEQAEVKREIRSPTGGLESSGFSPTSPRQGPFDNKFSGLATLSTGSSQTPPNSRVPSSMAMPASQLDAMKSPGASEDVSEAFEPPQNPPTNSHGSRSNGTTTHRERADGNILRRPLEPVSGNAVR